MRSARWKHETEMDDGMEVVVAMRRREEKRPGQAEGQRRRGA